MPEQAHYTICDECGAYIYGTIYVAATINEGTTISKMLCHKCSMKRNEAPIDRPR